MRGDLPIVLPSQRDIDLNALLAVLLLATASDERREEMTAGSE